MNVQSVVLALAGILLLGCAQVEPTPAKKGLVLNESNVNIVIARYYSKDTGPIGISDTQVYDGKIYVHATFKWDDLTAAGGEHEVEFRWYSGGKAVSADKKTHKFTPPPY